jgi:hypothetical protein
MAGRINSTFIDRLASRFNSSFVAGPVILSNFILLATSSVICFSVLLLFVISIIIVHARCQKKPTPKQRTIYHQPPANNVYWKSDSTTHLV